MSDDVPVLPSDWQSLLDYYQHLYPRAKEPVPILRNGYWAGIQGQSLGSFISFDTLRVKLANEQLIDEERRDFLFSGECPGVSFVALASDGSLQVDNSAYEPHSPPPSYWSSPVPEGGNVWLNEMKDRS